MTRNWLVEVAPIIKVAKMVEYIPPYSSATPNLDSLLEKLATAETLGKELAHKEPDLIKTAMTPGLLGMGKTVANVMSKNPAKALRVGGALAGGTAGALHTPGIDPNSGQQRSRIGSTLVGAAAGYGAGSMAGKSQAVKGFVQNQGGELKNVVQQARQAQKATKAVAPAAAIGTPSAPTPAAGQQLDLNLAPGSGVNPATAGAKKWYNPSSWFNKAAEALEVNEGLADHGPLSGTGKPSVLVAPKGEGKMKKALALPPGMAGIGRKALSLAAKHPTATLAAGGAAAGAVAGGPNHRLGGAAIGAGLGAGASKIPQVSKVLQRGAGAGTGAIAPAASKARTLAGVTPSGGTLNGMGAPATSASKIAPAQAGAPSLAGGSGSIPASGLGNPALKPSPQHLSDAPWEDVAAGEWGADSPSHQQVVERYLSGSGLKPGGSLGTAATQLQRPSGTMVGAGGIASARPATQPLRAGMPTAATRSIPRQSMAQMAA